MSNNKESFTLLPMSDESESLSDIPEIVLNPRKKRIKRRKQTAGPRIMTPNRPPPAVTVRCIGISICAVLLFCWILLLSWLAIVLHAELKRLDSNVQTVSVSSQGVPEALQHCHESTKELQRNQSMLAGQVAELAAQLANFSQQLTTVQTGLDAVQNRFKTSPELVNVPHQLDELSESVVQFGSQIKDISTTVGILKEQSNKQQAESNTLKQNISSIQLSLTNMTHPAMESNKSTEDKKVLLNLIKEMDSKILDVNKTFSKNLQWVQDEQKEHKITINQLTEDSANISTRVSTLQGSLLRHETQILNFNGTVNDLMYKVLLTNNATSILSNQMQNLGSKISLLENNESVMSKAMKLQTSEAYANTSLPTSRAEVMKDTSTIVQTTIKPPENVSTFLASVTSSTGISTTPSTPKVLDTPATGKPSVLSAPAE